MVGKMHETMKKGRPAEEERLDQAMTTMDPILRASLKREQQQRSRRNLFYGGLAMGTIIGLFFLVLFNQDANPDDGSKSSQNVEDVADSEDLSGEAWALWRSGKAGAAEAKFHEALAANEKDATLWNGLGWSQFYLGKHDLAIESFQKCVKYDESNEAGHYGLEQAYLAKSEQGEEPNQNPAGKGSRPAQRRGLAGVQNDVRVVFDSKTGQVTLLGDKADTEIVRKMFQRMSSKDSEGAKAKERTDSGLSAQAHAAKGWKQFQSGENSDAEQSFRMALKKDAKMQSAENGLGFALLNQGKTEAAKPIFERLVKANPKHPGFVNGLARCYENSGDLGEAVKLWKTMEKGSGPPNALTWGIARSLVQLEKFDDAMPYLKRIKAAGGPHSSGVDALIAKCEAGK